MVFVDVHVQHCTLQVDDDDDDNARQVKQETLESSLQLFRPF